MLIVLFPYVFLSCSKAAVRELIKNQADVMAREKNWMTPLHRAAHNNQSGAAGKMVTDRGRQGHILRERGRERKREGGVGRDGKLKVVPVTTIRCCRYSYQFKSANLFPRPVSRG